MVLTNLTIAHTRWW